MKDLNKEMIDFKTVTKRINSSVELVHITMTANDYENNFYADLGEVKFYKFHNLKFDPELLLSDDNLKGFKKIRNDRFLSGLGSIVIITEFRIFRKYRESGLGSLFLEFIKDTYDSTIALQSHPFEVEAKETKDFIVAYEKLMSFYEKNGFVTYPEKNNKDIVGFKLMVFSDAIQNTNEELFDAVA